MDKNKMNKLMSMNEKSRLPMIERVKLPEVKKIVEAHIKTVLELHNYRLRIELFYLGGLDECEIVGFTDMGSQRPIMIDYNENEKEGK